MRHFAFCLFKYFPYGGLQRDFLRIAKECVARGHKVDVYTMRWEGLLDPALNIHVLPSRGWQNHSRAQHFVQQLQKRITQEKYDLVVGFNKIPGLDVYYAADTCYQAKASQQRGVWYRYTPRYRHLIAYENAVFAKEVKTKILLIAEAQQAEFMRYYQTPPERFSVLPPGISRDRVAPDNADELRQLTRHEFNLSDQDVLLLMVGSGFKTKGLDRILTGVASLPEDIKQRVKLFIIGDDNFSPFKQQAEQLNIMQHIVFLGGRDDVARFFLAADLLLHPAYNENTGTVLLEAVVSGLPVLTTDVCGYASYIRSAKAGRVLSSPFQQAAFNAALADMILSPERDIWRQNGIAFAQQADIYRLPEVAANIIELATK